MSMAHRPKMSIGSNRKPPENQRQWNGEQGILVGNLITQPNGRLSAQFTPRKRPHNYNEYFNAKQLAI